MYVYTAVPVLTPTLNMHINLHNDLEVQYLLVRVLRATSPVLIKLGINKL